MNALLELLAQLGAYFRATRSIQEPAPAPQPALPPQPAPTPPAPAYVPPKLINWSSPSEAYHATRVLCDERGLTPEQKDILCACVYQESAFLANPRPNQNKDPKSGAVWSTDYGIVQINDHFHIGAGKDFPSVAFVLANPEKCLRWMIGIYKSTGALQPWASYTSGAYKKWLQPDSPMWKL